MAALFFYRDFVHRNVYRLAVEYQSYKRVLESFGRKRGWIFEVEKYDKVPCEYREVDGLLVERPENCVVSCLADWVFIDAFAVMYFRRDDISLDRLKELGRWKRFSGTNTRVWSAIKYDCSLFNTRLGEKVFNFTRTSLRQGDIRELVEEAVEKVMDFADLIEMIEYRRLSI